MPIVTDPSKPAKNPANSPSQSTAAASDAAVTAPCVVPLEDRLVVLLEGIAAALERLEDRWHTVELIASSRDPAASPPAPELGPPSHIAPLALRPPSPSFATDLDQLSVDPPLALRCDGRVLLCTTDLDRVDLSAREHWRAIVLTESEASAILARLPFEEAASPTAARILAKAKKPKPPSDDDA